MLVSGDKAHQWSDDMPKDQKLTDILFAAVDSETGAEVAYPASTREEYAKLLEEGGAKGVHQLIEFAAVYGKIEDSDEKITKPFYDDPELCTGQTKERSLIVNDQVFAARVKPTTPIPYETMVAHGIRDEDLEGFPSFEAHFEEFIKETKGFVLLIHNAAYDWPVFNWHAEKIGSTMKPFAVVDTFRLARFVLPDQRYHSNQYLMHQFGVPRLQGHLAAPDSAVTLMVFKRLVDLYIDKFGDNSLEGLCKNLSKPIKRKIWPFGKHKGTMIEKLPSDFLHWWFVKRIVEDYESEDWELNYWAAIVYDEYNRGRTNETTKCLENFRKKIVWPCYD